jgi:hypothetical protein
MRVLEGEWEEARGQHLPVRTRSQSSSDYIRWVQQSLNKILGLRLTADGVMGRQTRSAIRSFQQKRGLKADGIVGPQTEAALKSALSGVGNLPGGDPFTRETVTGFSRYVKQVKSLPPSEQAKIDTLARRIAESFRPYKRPVRMIHFVGHADKDTPRRPAFEQQISEERAIEVQKALFNAVDRHASYVFMGSICPPLSERINFRVSGKGATQLVVPNPTAERERILNRRVEIFSNGTETTSVRARSVGFQAVSSPIEAAITDFCARANPAQIDGSNCFNAAKTAAKNLGCKSSTEPCCKIIFSGAQLARSKKLHDQCNSKKEGRFLEVLYQPLDKIIKQVQCALDNGCVVRAGVLSGICDDKPDLGCKRVLDNQQLGHLVWRDCPEHWILIFGHDSKRNEFVFYDSAQTSAMDRCNLSNRFGLLFYDDTANRLSTARKNTQSGVDNMIVNTAGFHVSEPGQKRYQVLTLRACQL